MTEKQPGIYQTRARRRAAGMRSLEVVAHEDEIAVLDALKARLGVSSRSEVLRVLIARTAPETLSPADAALLNERMA